MIRGFADPDVIHVDCRISPKDDIETINTEFILADLQSLDKVIPRLQKEARNDKTKQATLDAAEAALKLLNDGKTIFASKIDREPLRELFLLTAKPFLYVFNVDDAGLMDHPLKRRCKHW